MAALLLLFRLVRVFSLGARCRSSDATLSIGNVTYKVDDRKFPGSATRNYHTGNAVTIFQDIDFVILVAALLNA